jgi:hypothetical protein
MLMDQNVINWISDEILIEKHICFSKIRISQVLFISGTTYPIFIQKTPLISNQLILGNSLHHF